MSRPHLEQLRIQAEASFDGHGRIVGCYGVTIAASTEGQTLWIGAGVPDDMATELTAEFDRAPRSSSPSQPPHALDACERILGRDNGELTRASGPSYLVPDDIEFTVGTDITLSDGADTEALRRANPGNWHPIE